MKKSDIILPSKGMSAPIEIGSKVAFIDGSYTLTIDTETNQLIHKSLGLSNDIFIVIAINVSLPTEPSALNTLNYINNCIVKNIETNEISFCSKINIVNIVDLYNREPILK